MQNVLFISSMHWSNLMILSMVFLGMSMSLFKVPSINKNVQPELLTVWMSIFFLVFGTILLINYSDLTHFTTLLVSVAILQGFVFSIRSLLQLKALHYSATNTLFTVTSTLSLVVVIVFGLLFLGEKINTIQTLGLFLSLTALFFWSYKKGITLSENKTSFLLFVGVIATSASGNLLNKLGASFGDIFGYQFVYYIAALLSAVGLYYYKHKNIKSAVTEINKPTLLTAIGISITGFIGGLCLIQALVTGPVSIVQSINSQYILVTAFIGVIFFKEKLTKKKAILIFFILVAIVLLRLK